MGVDWTVIAADLGGGGNAAPLCLRLAPIPSHVTSWSSSFELRIGFQGTIREQKCQQGCRFPGSQAKVLPPVDGGRQLG